MHLEIGVKVDIYIDFTRIEMNNSISTVTGKIKIKIVFLGDQSVGKSSIIDKYVNDKFDETAHPTVGIDFLAKNILYKTKNYRLQLWDTAGQERFKSLIPGYLRDSHCSLIVFDVNSKSSLNSAENWLHLYNENKTGDGFTLLIGNKIDLKEERQVTVEEGNQKAKELGVIYYEVSAKTGENLQQLFSNIIQICSEKSLDGANFNLKLNKSILPEKDVIPEDANEGKGDDEKENKVDERSRKLKLEACKNIKEKKNCC